MPFLQTAAAFIFVLGIIIFVHESGHLIVAKAFVMRVFIFSFGFGKRLFGCQWGDTDCRVSLVPLGGYVKLEGEPEDHLSEDTSALGDGRDFTSRPRWQKFLVYLAGPAMNAVLTISGSSCGRLSTRQPRGPSQQRQPQPTVRRPECRLDWDRSACRHSSGGSAASAASEQMAGETGGHSAPGKRVHSLGQDV